MNMTRFNVGPFQRPLICSDDISFQTWICPICCDDHRQPLGNEVRCKPEDLLAMRKEINTLNLNLNAVRTEPVLAPSAPFNDFRSLVRDLTALFKEANALYEKDIQK